MSQVFDTGEDHTIDFRFDSKRGKNEGPMKSVQNDKYVTDESYFDEHSQNAEYPGESKHQDKFNIEEELVLSGADPMSGQTCLSDSLFELMGSHHK